MMKIFLSLKRIVRYLLLHFLSSVITTIDRNYFLVCIFFFGLEYFLIVVVDSYRGGFAIVQVV